MSSVTPSVSPPATAAATAGNFATMREVKSYVGERVSRITSSFGGYVDERLRRISSRLNGHVLDSTNTIAEKISDIAQNTSGECSYEESSKPYNLHISERRLKFANELRKTNEKEFEKVADFAKKYVDNNAGTKDNNVESILFFSRLTGFSSPTLLQRMEIKRQKSMDI
jgi:hypothetical protein